MTLSRRLDSTWEEFTQRAGPPLRVALLAAFGLVAAVWLVAGYYLSRRMAELERRSTAVNARYMRAQDLLTEVRGQVLTGSVYVRDALLDPDQSGASTYRRQLEESYLETDRVLATYEPVLDTDAERLRIVRLRSEIDAFRRTLLEVLATDSTRWRREARLLLRTRIVPKREGVMRVSDEVQALNRAAFIQQQHDVAAIYAATQHRVWEILGLAVAASLLIGLVSTSYAARLEARLQQQRLKDAETAKDLQRLSARLLTAQEEERRHIARELHDEVGQVLTAIKVELSIAESAIQSAGGPKTALHDARAITEGALHTVRDLSHLLHPALLDDLGLPTTVDWYLKGFRKRHGLAVELLQERMDERLAGPVEAAAYRIIQEALTNVARHARATRCRVYLQRLTHTVLVTVEDDGIGFDPSAHADDGAERGLGLVGIRERVALLQGTMRLESAPNRGTRVTVELPALDREDNGLRPDDAAAGPALPEASGG